MFYELFYTFFKGVKSNKNSRYQKREKSGAKTPPDSEILNILTEFKKV